MAKTTLSKKFLSKYWVPVSLILLGFVFFLGTSAFNYSTQSYAKDQTELDFVKWTSPDETANYIFAKLYGQSGQIKVYEKYNLYTKDIMHPRSFRSDFGKLKPMSFLGIILIYGKIVSLTSYKILPYLTPFFAAIGIVYFYLLLKLLFGKTNAYISAFLLALLPPYIYYSSRSMFHNVLFVVLLTISLYYLLRAAGAGKKKKDGQLSMNFFNKTSFKKDYKKWLYAATGGLFLGLTVITRTSELVWLGPSLLLLWLLNMKRVGITNLAIILSFAFLGVLPALYHNQVLYGSMFMGGYAEMNTSIMSLKEAGENLVVSTGNGVSFNYKNFLETARDNIFHFGFHPRHSLKMSIEYFVKMFYWIFWPAAFGLLIWLFRFRRHKYRHWVYLSVWTMLSGILLLYYGSWEFHDNPDPTQFTIGNSYTRYWLPVYMGSLPFVSYLIIRLTTALRSLYAKTVKSANGNKFVSLKFNRKLFLATFRSAILIGTAYLAITFVIFGSKEGLLFMAHKQDMARVEWKKILELTEGNSTLITRYHDKLFFPERKVIVGLFDDKRMIEQYANLEELLPVYYYNFDLPEQDLEYLNNRRLAEAGLGIREVERVSKDFTLYKLFKQATSSPSRAE